MQNVYCHHRPFIEINLTCRQWALYDIAGAAKAATELNKLSAEAINSSANRSEAATKLRKILAQFAKFGAADTEGEVVASDLIDIAFPYR